MINALFGDTNYLAAKRMLDVSALRQEAIASNLANIETPNYKRVDVSKSFESQLQQAVASNDPSQIQSAEPTLAVDNTTISSRSDGNNVQLESELLKLNQNMVEHSLETQLVGSMLTKMRTAITGKD